jgi:hypothetical protein
MFRASVAIAAVGTPIEHSNFGQDLKDSSVGIEEWLTMSAYRSAFEKRIATWLVMSQ